MTQPVIKQIQALVTKLNQANKAYYQHDTPIMSDLEYDKLYDQLQQLEKEFGLILSSSPTQAVGHQVVSNLQKATHQTPMLSLDKTKDPAALAGFLDTSEGGRQGILSWKLDGLTIVLRYENGQLAQAITRGNGTIGEDVTHNARVFVNIPLTISEEQTVTIRGEAVIPFADFEEINAQEEIKYKNPRNLCSGAVRQLNSEITASRRVYFYAFGIMEHMDFTNKSEQLAWLEAQGFSTPAYTIVTSSTVEAALEDFRTKVATHPLATDGLVLTFDDIAYSQSLGSTSKFPRDSLAFKWKDELAETTLIDIEWNTSRTGLINPVAIFEPVDIEGSQVSRASLHNVSIVKEMSLTPGDKITVYKANMIIPQVGENLTKHATPTIPTTCPVCGEGAHIIGDPEALYCTNSSCDALKLQGFTHFVSRNALNIAGLSEQTLDKLVGAGYLANYLDIFSLDKHRDGIIAMEGLGEKSYTKLMEAIEAAKNIALPNFLYALGIKHLGLSNAKLLCSHFASDYEAIIAACTAADYMAQLLEIKGFGESIAEAVHGYFAVAENLENFHKAMEILDIQVPPAPSAEAQKLAGLVFVITGDVQHYKNRKELQNFIEANGGKVTGSVTGKTSYLINNDRTSTTGKNKKAQALGVEILTEDGFLERMATQWN